MRIFLALVVSLLFSQKALATTYCHYPPGAYYVEGDNKREWVMTASKYRKILNPTQTKPTTACAVNFSNLGPIKSLSIIKKPNLNTAATWRGYQVNYQAIKTGNDTMTVEIEWYDRSNNIRKGLVHYDIKVVDHEL